MTPTSTQAAELRTPQTRKSGVGPGFEWKGNAQAGKDKSESERCQECHGADGNGAGHANGSEGKFAKLAGQYPQYLVKQILDLRSGARKHDFMSVMAKSLEEADIRDIAAYFGSLPAMTGDGSGNNEVGRKLFTQGDPKRGIAACVSCHGEYGQGGVVNGQITPLIAGQEWRYLNKQLYDWKTGERSNSPGAAMNLVTRQLEDSELDALTNYISGLRAP